jgi:glycosyltransferase involved in cell wall biosynthesis
LKPVPRPKILFVSYRFHPEVGGTETLIDEITKRLANQGFDVVVACFTTRSGLPSEELAERVRIVRHFVRPKTPSWSAAFQKVEWRFAGAIDKLITRKSAIGKVLGLLSQLFVLSHYVPCLSMSSSMWLLRVVMRERPGIVHVFDSKLACVIYPVAYLARLPVVVTFPGTAWVGSSRARCYDKLCYSLDYSWYLMHEDGTGAATIAGKVGVTRVSSFFSGVDPLLFDPWTVSRIESRRRFGISQDSFVFGILGRVERIKGVYEIVLSFLDTAEEKDVLLVGGPMDDERYYGEITRLTAGSKNGNLVKFVGPVERAKVPNFLAASDVMLSDRQFLNLAFAESLMMGRPVVANARGIGVLKKKLEFCSTVLLYDEARLELPNALRRAKGSWRNASDFSRCEAELAREVFSWDAVMNKVLIAYRHTLPFLDWGVQRESGVPQC